MKTYKFNFQKSINKTNVRKGHHENYGTFSKYGNEAAVYGIKCTITNKVYIGSTKHIQRRLMKHFSELHLNRHRAKELQKDFNTYGRNSFIIIIYYQGSENLLNILSSPQNIKEVTHCL